MSGAFVVPREFRPGREGREWRAARAAVLVPGVTCAWPDCPHPGVPLDLDLPRADPWSATVDHHVELVDGGHPTDPANLAPMHRTCNQAKENRRRSKARLTPPKTRPATRLRPRRPSPSGEPPVL